MEISKYKNPIILLIIYYIFFGLFFGVIAENMPNRPVVLIVFLVALPLLALGGVFAGGYLLAPLFLFLHKTILGRKMVYGIEDKKENQKFGKTWRGLVPALMTLTLTISLVFNDAVQAATSQLFNIPSSDKVDIVMSSFIVLLMIMIFVSTFVFGGIWYLQDSCVIYSSIEKNKDTDQPTEHKSVGGNLKTFLKGYAGIGALLAYYMFAADLLNIISGGNIANDVSFLLFAALILFGGFPFLLSLAILPAVILADVLREQRINFVRKWANKFGITKYVKMDFPFVEG